MRKTLKTIMMIMTKKSLSNKKQKETIMECVLGFYLGFTVEGSFEEYGQLFAQPPPP